MPSASLLRCMFWVAAVSVAAIGLAEPVLQTPATTEPLHLAVPRPATLKDAVVKLVDQATSAEIVAQAVPASGPDGQVGGTCLAATVPPAGGAPKPREFRLASAEAAAAFEWKDLDDRRLGLFEGGKPVFVYNHGVITGKHVPEDDMRRNRSTFVHPLYGLKGEVLTESFPKDHYHHHGLFWSWPHIQLEGKEYNLWVYSDIQQRFVKWLAKEAGPAAAVLAVENGWFIDKKKVAVERIWLRTFLTTGNARAIDVSLVFIPVDKPITLWGAPQKSYGGMNLRFGPRQETLITVPTGRTKADLPDTPLAWADLTAKFAGAPGPSGAAVFVDPRHPNFPPTWLTRHYGILCVGWPGVKPRTFAAGTPVRLDYRVWVHDGTPEPKTLQAAYDAFAAGAKAAWRP